MIRKHVDDSRLQILVFGDEESADYQLAAAHVETCEECQVRLDRLTGSNKKVTEIGELLGGYAKAGSGDPFAAECHDSGSLDFLSPPNHPEMLGRLGRYEIERVVGAGGMGIVLKGFDTELSRPVAIKVLASHLAHSGAARQRFARESRAAAAIVHEHVIAIHNVETDGEMPFIVMRYVEGESLQARVDRDGPLAAKEILRIGIQAAAGLAAAHEQGVVHRDVKPANILLENGVERTLLTDFGLARTVDDASLTRTGILAGTPHYMSPEQANGEATDPRTDLFSLGSVLYFMATGRPPFRAERAMGVLKRICHDRHRPIWQVNPELPDQLCAIIDRLLQKKPKHRFAGAAEVRQSLATALSKIQQRTFRPSHLRRFAARYHRALISLTAMIAFLGVLSLTLISYFANRDGPSHRDVAVTASVAPDQSAPNRSAARKIESAPGSTSGPSIEIIGQASASEADNYTAELKSIQSHLSRLEVAQDAYFDLPRDSTWNAQVQSLHKRLSRLQGETHP